jgi:hypothetical protein
LGGTGEEVRFCLGLGFRVRGGLEIIELGLGFRVRGGKYRV